MLVNIGQLDSMNAEATVVEKDIESRTGDGLTAIEMAVLFEQPDAVRWLIEHGAAPDVVSLRDLDEKAQVERLIEHQSQVLNWKAGQNVATALHVVVERNDEELAD
ncbi:uncharacterized protein RHO25_003999 [Cercospora beticola]|uniref:Ankyrin repeat domain-containing protein n=1 Tax=Cercospora beticola TaxID=122368 RepID=A0ABZ0NIP9_CERBT|nr:hypothetical protein RHO25_003999 [Cercospora beticola]CAK1362497.1 unnamed protein product [Cercospora beticola]